MDNKFYFIKENEFFINYFNGLKKSMLNPHLHDNFEITLVIKGKCRILIGEKSEEQNNNFLTFFP